MLILRKEILGLVLGLLVLVTVKFMENIFGYEVRPFVDVTIVIYLFCLVIFLVLLTKSE